ncbi:MAG: hypothetical protein KKC51_00150 [Verrucomicrobia bacterium]|nr:hypothetical protein [Verrucomicrobiota bacterium]
MKPEPRLHSHLPRLQREFYKGHAFVHWILTTDKRKTDWLTPLFHSRWREILVHASARYSLACPVYCLMPDHAHVLWLGLAPESDQLMAMEFFRKNTRLALAPCRWQAPAYDHVLKEKERERNAFQATAYYILENPVRAELVATASEYPYSSTVVAGYPDLEPHGEEFWPLFWRIYKKMRKE